MNIFVKSSIFGFLSMLALWPLLGCPAQQAATEIDLMKLHAAARKIIETGEPDLLSPFNSYYLPGGGWSDPYRDDENGPVTVAAVSRESSFRFSVIIPAERWLCFSAAAKGKFGGPDNQSIRITVGGQQIAQFRIAGEGGSVQQVRIPADLQHAGDNFVYFHFSEFIENPVFRSNRNERRGSPYPGIAAYFTGLKIVFGDGSGPCLSEARKDSEVIAWSGDNKFLVQHPNSEIRYALESDGGRRAILHFSGNIQGDNEETSQIKVTLRIRTDSKPQWEVLWSKEFDSASGTRSHDFQDEISLADVAEDRLELGISVVSNARFSNSTVVWKRLNLELSEDKDGATEKKSLEPVRLDKGVRNVIMIILDAARPDYFGVYGDDRELTPFIDRFAESATVFTNAVAAAPYTVASVSTIFSGVLPEIHGVRHGRAVYPEDLTNLAAEFKAKGYYTVAMAGLPFIKRKFGITRACDLEIYLRRKKDRSEGFSTMDPRSIKRGIESAAASGKPVFLYAHFLPPHWPYCPPEPFGDVENHDADANERERRRLRGGLNGGIISADDEALSVHRNMYQSNLRYADQVVKRTIELLRSNGLYENSMIIIAADHGEALGEHQALGHSSTVYDEMIRVPLIVRIPGVEPRRVEQQVGLVDIFPTLRELFNLEVEETGFQGRSLAALFTGGEQTSGSYYYSRAVDNALGIDIDRIRFSLRGERYKYIFNDFVEELYDLLNDPAESENIAGRFPVLASTLRQRGMLLIATASELAGGEEVELLEDEEEELRNLGYLQ